MGGLEISCFWEQVTADSKLLFERLYICKKPFAELGGTGGGWAVDMGIKVEATQEQAFDITSSVARGEAI